MEKENIYSYSQISTFKNCREKYKIIYLDGIKKNQVSIEAFMGISVHQVLEWIYLPKNRKIKYFTFDDICCKYDEIWIKNWHSNIFIVSKGESKDLYYSIGKRCLSNYYSDYGPHFNEPVKDTELDLTFTLGDGYKIRGIIDRVDQPSPGKYQIHDYKTGKRIKSFRAAKMDIQLAIYQLAVEENLPEVKEINLNWHFVRHGKLLTINHDREDLKKLRKTIEKEIQNIKSARLSNNFYPTETLLCYWCYFWEECSAKVGKNPALRVE